MVVQVEVYYCGGCGYRARYATFQSEVTDLCQKQSLNISTSSQSTDEITGFFEVSVNGNLVHSKKNGDGYVDNDAKFNAIVDAIKDAA